MKDKKGEVERGLGEKRGRFSKDREGGGWNVGGRVVEFEFSHHLFLNNTN